jgi:hypothetical protein
LTHFWLGLARVECLLTSNITKKCFQLYLEKFTKYFRMIFDIWKSL